jgi:hypothetical protein
MILLVIGIFLLTGNSLFTSKPRYVMYFEGSVFGAVVGASGVVCQFFRNCCTKVEPASSSEVADSDNRVGEFNFGHEAMREFVIFEVFPEAFRSLGDFGMGEGKFPADFEERGLGFGGVEIRPPAGFSGSPVAGLDDVVNALVEGHFRVSFRHKKAGFPPAWGLTKPLGQPHCFAVNASRGTAYPRKAGDFSPRGASAPPCFCSAEETFYAFV